MNTKLSQHMDGSVPEFLQFQSKRVAIPGILAGLTSNVTVTWDGSFGDSLYTINYALQCASSLALSLDSILSMSATGCVIVVKNVSLATTAGTLHITGIHD
jgi:hypothetical protein